MTAGALIAGLCGACSIFWEVAFVNEWLTPDSGPPLFAPLFLPVMLGIVPVGVGIALFLWGRRMRRRAASA